MDGLTLLVNAALAYDNTTTPPSSPTRKMPQKTFSTPLRDNIATRKVKVFSTVTKSLHVMNVSDKDISTKGLSLRYMYGPNKQSIIKKRFTCHRGPVIGITCSMCANQKQRHKTCLNPYFIYYTKDHAKSDETIQLDKSIADAYDAYCPCVTSWSIS